MRQITEGNIVKFLRLIKVYDCGLTKMRVGNHGDGGYVVYKELCERSKVVYSAGIGGDIGFEKDWLAKYPDTRFKMYDPTIDKLPEEHNRFSFHRYGLGSKYKPLKDVIQDSMLKMDIEWDEWSAFQTMGESELRKFSQMLVEFHIVHAEPRCGLSPYFDSFYSDVFEKINEDLFATYYQVMSWLSNWFYIFHIHANNSLPMIEAMGCMLPPLLEISFVRKDLVKEHKRATCEFPMPELDVPNKNNRPDILDYYPFIRESTYVK